MRWSSGTVVMCSWGRRILASDGSWTSDPVLFSADELQGTKQERHVEVLAKAGIPALE